MINRRQHLRMGLGVLGGCAGATWLAKQTEVLHWREVIFEGLGTTLRLRAGHPHLTQLDAALHAAVAAVREVEGSMSLFDPHSELSRLNRSGRLRAASPALREVLGLSAHIAQVSQGVFDATTQPLWQAWSAWAQEDVPLSAAWKSHIAQARSRVNWRGVHLVYNDVHLAAGVALSLNGVAQGYAADRAKAALQAHGIVHALLDTGETSMMGQSPDGPWRLQLAPEKGSPAIAADGRCVATSSDDQTRFSADGRYHHILDPRTGYSPTLWSRITVLAHSAATADALTKVFFMLPPQNLLASAAHWGVDVMAQNRAGRWLHTPGVPLLAST